MSITLQIFAALVSESEPPKTVKSCANAYTTRPSTRPWPVTTPSPGTICRSMPKSRHRWVTSLSTSSKVSGSNSASIRSRAVSLPASRCRARRSTPPPSSARRSRSCSLSIGFIIVSGARASRSDDGIGERAHAADLDHDTVAGHERTDPRRGAGRQDVAGLERHEAGHVLYQGRDREDELIGVRVLAAVAVHPAFDLELRRVEAHGDAGSEGRERIEALGARVLDVLLLQLAGGDIAQAGDAEDVMGRIGGAHARSRPADDDGHLRFVIDAARPGRGANRFLGADDRRRRLQEHERLGGQRLVHLGGVIL